MAASPGEDDDFTLFEWSKALLDLNLLPDMESVFRLGFLAKSSNTAYTVAGAFVSWVHDRYGADAVRGWYGGLSLEQVTGGKSLAALDRDFRADLAKIQLCPELSAMAKARFDRPSISDECARVASIAISESPRIGSERAIPSARARPSAGCSTSIRTTRAHGSGWRSVTCATARSKRLSSVTRRCQRSAAVGLGARFSARGARRCEHHGGPAAASRRGLHAGRQDRR